MSTREVTREEWGPFFDAFSGTHHGWLASVEVFSDELGSRQEIHNLPLEGISADFEGGTTQVTISAGNSPELHVAHTVSAPTHVWLKQSEEAPEATLELETLHGVTLVRVRAPASGRVDADPDASPDAPGRGSTASPPRRQARSRST